MNQSITVVSGIGESTKNALAEHGIRTVADLAKVSVVKLVAVKGFSEFRAAKAIAAAVALLKARGEGAAAQPKAESAKKTKAKKKQKKRGPAKDKKGKNKKKKGSKKKDKKKNKKSKKKK